MKTGFTCLFSVLVFSLALGAGMSAPTGSVGEERGQPRHDTLQLYVAADRRSEDRDKGITGTYVKGMPIILMVRLVNISAKHDERGAHPIAIRWGWQRDVRFTLTADGKQVECKVSPLTPEGPVTNKEEIAVWRDDLLGQWLIDGTNTAGMAPGIYQVDCRYRDAVAKPVSIRLGESRGEQDRLGIQARETHLQWLKGNHDQALTTGEMLLDQRARMRPGDVAELLNLLARICENKEQYGKAVVYLEEWRDTARMSDEIKKVVENRINQLKQRAENQKKQGVMPRQENVP